MTCKDTTIPITDTEPGPQDCGADPLDLADIPEFLQRSPKPAEPAGGGEAMRSTSNQGQEQ